MSSGRRVSHGTGRIGTANFDCDGKGHLVSEGLTVLCTQKAPSDYSEISAFKNRSKVPTAHWELSNHGNALTTRRDHASIGRVGEIDRDPPYANFRIVRLRRRVEKH